MDGTEFNKAQYAYALSAKAKIKIRSRQRANNLHHNWPARSS